MIGAIVPWNNPLMIGAWKIAPALAMGNSVVLKPSEVASLSLLRLAEICRECGLPDGVLNVVTGQGVVGGEALALSMDVDVLVLTGTGWVGQRLLEYGARSNLKRVHLEPGGKSPDIVFADAPDLKQAAKVSAAGIFRNSGQVCVAGARLLVQHEVADDVSVLMAAEATALKVGNPLNLDTKAGAISSEAQLAGIAGMVAEAAEQGANLDTGGARLLASTGGAISRRRSCAPSAPT